MSSARRAGVVVVASVLALLMAACTGQSSPAPSSSSPAPSSASPAPSSSSPAPSSSSPAPSSSSPDPRRSSPVETFVRYVALGDSSAAGPVIRPQQTDQPRRCTRSAVNFPSLVAKALQVATFVDVTCSGATLDSVLEQDEAVPAQLEALTKDTDLVTVGPLGANDVGLVQAAFSCVQPGCAQRLGDRLSAKVGAARGDVRRVLAGVRTRAPKAKVVVVGYGRYLPRGACPEVQPITASDGAFLQGLLDDLDAVLRQEAARAGVEFLDLRAIPGAATHTACAPGGTRWVEGLLVGSRDGAVAYHPTKLGMQAFATAVVALVER